MSLRRTISKSYIGIHPECRTGQEIPRLDVGVTRRMSTPSDRNGEMRALLAGSSKPDAKKKTSQPIRLEF